MNNLDNIKGAVEKLRIQSQNLKNEIMSLKEQEISTVFYLNNLKKLSLQSLDLFSAMDKQLNLLANRKKIFEDLKKKQQRRNHELSVGR